MGKTKPRRKFGSEQRLQATTGIVSSSLSSSSSLNQQQENQESENGFILPNGISIRSLIEQLQSPESECRLVACTTVATLVADRSTIPHLMQHDVVRILGPLIIDPNIYIQNSAVGALRNLSVDGGFAVCVKMVERDIMTSLVALFLKYPVGWVPEKLCQEKGGDIYVETYFQAVNLLWNLCENSETAVRIFNKEKLVIPLVPCLNPDVYGYPLSLAVANCLHVVSENNPEICQYLNSPEALAMIENLISSKVERMDALLLRTLCAGLLVNMFSPDFTKSSTSSAILSTVSESLKLDTHSLLNQAAEKIAALETNGKSVEHFDSDKPNELKDVVDEMENLLKSQEISVEIAANMCCTGDNDDEYEEVDSEESLSSADEMIGDVEMETDNNETPSLTPCCLSSEIRQDFVQFNILRHVLQKIECPELPADNPLLLTCDNLKKSVHQLRVHSLLTLANLVSSLDLEDIGGAQCLSDIWQGLVKLARMPTDADLDLDYVEAVSNALRSVIQKISEGKMTKFSDLMSTESISMFEMMRVCPRQEVRVNAIRILSSIGSATLLDPSLDYKELKLIGQALVSMATEDKDLHVVAEALDAIFDLFAEDHVNLVMSEIGLLEQLRKLVSTFKAQATCSREFKRKLKEPVISMAKLNLVRFIQYKSNINTQQHTAMNYGK